MPQQKAIKSRGMFNPKSKDPFRLSRSRIDLFLGCPYCFYLTWRLGVNRPSMPGFTLNNAVDRLLKKEFDIHRAKNTTHPLMKAYKIDAVPFAHEHLEKWRDSLRQGISYLHKPTNLLVCGGIDDVWVKPNGELIIIDYKATATNKEISLDDKYKSGYKLQMEVYQWLFRKNNFKVSETGYFLFCNGNIDKEAFDGKLEFDLQLIPHRGDDSWIEPTLYKIHNCLMSEILPEASASCEYCAYRQAVKKFE
jgi:hypothetical protein